MPIPDYKIEIWRANSKLYEITDDAFDITVKDTLTSNIGTFDFSLPTVKGTPTRYLYNDVLLGDKAKIWFGHVEAGLEADPFVGKICQISAPLSTNEGYIRTFRGQSLGEILKRRIKKRKEWAGVGASTLVTELATDLSLGTEKIETDTTPLTLWVEENTYFDILQNVSDYWIDANTKILKDFYVASCGTHANGDLVWKSRPLRTAGVETIANEDIIACQVQRDIEAIKNSITAYGKAEKLNPLDGDTYTEGASVPPQWTITYGTGAMVSDAYKGSQALQITSELVTGVWHALAYCTWPSVASAKWAKEYQDLVVAAKVNGEVSLFRVKLYAPDVNNAFYWVYTDAPRVGKYDLMEIPVGPKSDARWLTIGTPAWDNIATVEFWAQWSAQQTIKLDFLHFAYARYSGFAEDTTSQADYGVRELSITDDALPNDTECGKRALTMIKQLKDPPVRLDVTIPGNTNIKIGDRLSMTIPAENIDSVDYDVVTVIKNFNKETGFTTSASMLNSTYSRHPQPTTMPELIKREHETQLMIAKGIQMIK